MAYYTVNGYTVESDLPAGATPNYAPGINGDDNSYTQGQILGYWLPDVESKNTFTPQTNYQLPAGVPAYQPMAQGSQFNFAPTSSMFGPSTQYTGTNAMSGTPNNHWLNQANQRGQQVSNNYGALTTTPMPMTGLLGGLK